MPAQHMRAIQVSAKNMGGEGLAESAILTGVLECERFELQGGGKNEEKGRVEPCGGKGGSCGGKSRRNGSQDCKGRGDGEEGARSDFEADRGSETPVAEDDEAPQTRSPLSCDFRWHCKPPVFSDCARIAGNNWWARKDSNLGPTDYESAALTS